MPKVSHADYERLYEFRYSIRRFLRFSEQAARAAGLDPQQHQLLLVLKANAAKGSISVGLVAERLLLRHHSAVELVDRAEQRGLVRRRPSDADRRQVFVEITAAGEAVLEDLSVQHLAELQSAGADLVAVLNNIVRSGRRSAQAGPVERHVETPN